MKHGAALTFFSTVTKQSENALNALQVLLVAHVADRSKVKSPNCRAAPNHSASLAGSLPSRRLVLCMSKIRCTSCTRPFIVLA